MIIRSKHDGKAAPYAVISRKLLQENQLPYEPKCLLLLMLSYPDTWNFNIKNLADTMQESVETIRSWLDTLSKFGYFHEDVTLEIGENVLPVAWLVTEYPVEVKKYDR